METNAVIVCDKDSFSIDEIVFAKIVQADRDNLTLLEERINGNRDISQGQGSAENPILSEALIDEIRLLLNKYSREIAVFLPNPPKGFDSSSNSKFDIPRAVDRAQARYYQYLTEGTYPDECDLSILWNYRYYCDNDSYTVPTGAGEKKISLRQDVYPALKALVYHPPKTQQQQNKETRNFFINLGLSVIGLNSIRLDEGSYEISAEGKAELQSLYQKLEHYFFQIEANERAKHAKEAREQQYREFMDTNEGREMLIIKTTRRNPLISSSESSFFYTYLDGYCNFDIRDKKKEIDDTIQIRNSYANALDDNAPKACDIIICDEDTIPVSAILFVKLTDFSVFTARQKFYEYFSSIYPQELMSQKYREFMGASKERKMLLIKTGTNALSGFAGTKPYKFYEYVDGLCGFDIFKKKQEIEEKIQIIRQQITADKLETRNQIIDAFNVKSLLCYNTLSTANKYKEFSTIRAFCCRYIPQLNDRDFDIDSLAKKYPLHISQDHLAAFKANWIRMCRSLNALKRGIKGEEKVYEVLRLFDDRCRIIRSYTWDVEHDFIVITPYGISTIEVKTLSGDYILTETGMLKCLSNDQIEPKDVALQSKKHVEKLRRHLNGCPAFKDSVPLQEIICSAEANFTIKDEYHHIPVCYYNTIDKALFTNSKKVLSEKAMDEIQSYLLANQQEDFQFDVFLPRGELDSRETFIEAFADVASGLIVATEGAK